MSLAIWDHTVLPATRHKWTHPTLTPARGRCSIYLPRRDGRLSWPRWPLTYTEIAYPPTDSSKYYNPAVHGRESNSRPVDHKSDAPTKPPSDPRSLTSVLIEKFLTVTSCNVDARSVRASAYAYLSHHVILHRHRDDVDADNGRDCQVKVLAAGNCV